MKAPQRKLSTTLVNRVQLTPEQLERINGQAGEGLASKYGTDGMLSLPLVRKLQKAKRRAKKFVLYTDELGQRLYISSNPKAPLTFNKHEALLYFEGFDLPELKIRYWKSRIPLLNFLTTHS